jgi:hypothetical protein
MQESSLHAALKLLYASRGGRQEVLVDGYLIDVVLDDLLVEIQTRNFSALKPKLIILLEKHAVRLVHPIALKKWIVTLPKHGDRPISRRKSPKKGRIEDLFNELVHIGHLVSHPDMQVELLHTYEEEIRRDDGQGSWRRKGVSIVDRRLLEVIEERTLNFPKDYLSMLPKRLPQPFTNRHLAEALKIRLNLAQKMSYSLRAMGILVIREKSGNALLQEINPEL